MGGSAYACVHIHLLFALRVRVCVCERQTVVELIFDSDSVCLPITMLAFCFSSWHIHMRHLNGIRPVLFLRHIAGYDWHRQAKVALTSHRPLGDASEAQCLFSIDKIFSF